MKTPGLVLCLLVSIASMARAADFTVTNTSNSGAGSLRQAILDANATANAGGQDRIIFNIPGPGVHIIDVSSQALPQITNPVIIDGYTQPGAKPNTLSIGNDAVILIQIDNHNNFIGTGLDITAGTSIVRGLSLTGFGSSGINLGNPGAANIVEGNFIGLKPDGQSVGSNGGIGINVGVPGNLIGGTAPQARNVLAGGGPFPGVGVWVSRQPNTISGNYIGTNASGTVPLAHQRGIHVEGVTGGVVIGGTTPGAGNVISGMFTGIQLGIFGSFLGNPFEVPASGVEITGNRIGLASDGQTPLRNNSYGIYVLRGSNNLIGGLAPGAANSIAFYGDSGVVVAHPNAINNKILSNSIYGRGLGIALGFGPTRNDPQDPDSGPNRFQNFPIITSTSISGAGLSIQGTLNSTPNTSFTIQLFAHGADYFQPTRVFLATANATTDNSGNANFSAAVPMPSGNFHVDERYIKP